MAESAAGKALIQASRPFAEEALGTTWRLFAVTVGAYALGVLGIVYSPYWPMRLVFAIYLGLVNVRLFIFYHDAMHGAIFRRSVWGRRIMAFYGLLILTPARIWKDSHNYHHAHTSKIVGSSIGSFPLVTLRMYEALSPAQRFLYRLARNGLNMLLGYFTIFALGMCVRPFMQQPRRYFSSLVSLLLHVGIMVGLSLAYGFELAFFAYQLPLAVSCAMGAYLFYAQHNYPDMKLYGRADWEYSKAALHSSSMMHMGRVMHWFTGNIGYHHVHHLNAMIPFYRLPEAMQSIAALQSPGATTLRPREIWRCLGLFVWDTDAERMLSKTEYASRGRSLSEAAVG